MSADAATEARRRVALNARRVRASLGWTQEQAAERIGCSVQALQRIERAAAAATLDFVARIAEAYAVDVAVLLAPAGAWASPVPGRPPRGAALRRRAGAALRRGPGDDTAPVRAPLPRRRSTSSR